MVLEWIEGEYAVCQLPAQGGDTKWMDKSGFWSVTATDEEISVVCRDMDIPAEVRKESGWCMMRIGGSLDFSLVGILSAIIAPLGEKGISVYTISTFNTDYILIKKYLAGQAQAILEESGHTFEG
jgi:uncharacterized protein